MEKAWPVPLCTAGCSGALRTLHRDPALLALGTLELNQTRSTGSPWRRQWLPSVGYHGTHKWRPPPTGEVPGNSRKLSGGHPKTEEIFFKATQMQKLVQRFCLKRMGKAIVFFYSVLWEEGSQEGSGLREPGNFLSCISLRNQEDRGKTLRVKVRSGGCGTHKQLTSRMNLKEIIAKEKNPAALVASCP